MPFAMRADGAGVERWVATVARDVDVAPVEGEIRAIDAGIVITEPVVGRALDRAAASSALLNVGAGGDRALALRASAVHPAVDGAGMSEAAAAVRSIITPVQITALGRGIDENAVGLGTLIDLEKVEAKPGELPALPAGTIAPATRYRYIAALNEERVRTWADAVADVLDQPARNASYAATVTSGLTVIPSQAGARIDRDAFASAVMSGLFRPASEPVRVIAAQTVAEAPTFTTEEATKYTGGMTRLSGFQTYYPYNLARWANISTGARQFNNRVIAPGETFSFWRLLGPVTVERGYAFAGAIIDGRSNNNVIGGGLCQVSTTLFMAVAQAGFQIVERGAHEYYIDRYPLGLDAAVFEPGLDLKWRNDTPYPVLIRSSSTQSSVAFELFSIPNGRTVTFGEPVESNWTDVRPGQLADPAFPPGAKVLGRDVTRTRTVMQGDAVVHRDLFRSRYIPVWGGPGG
ncbi:hypothetical protein BH18CHL2_BH18CHL2_08290 [soil metagenome]